MRKDVKFGLTIGGLLILVLVMWVAVVNRSAEKKPKATVVENWPDSNITDPSSDLQIPAPSDHAPADHTPATGAQPAAKTDNQFAIGGSNTNGLNVGASRIAAPPHKDDWGALLAGGGTIAPRRSLDSNDVSAPVQQLALTHRASTDSVDAATASAVISASNSEVPVSDPLSDRPSTGATASAANPPPRAAGAKSYVVAQGDTFSSISASVYGSSKYWKRLADANPRVSPNRLSIGTVLNVPELPMSISTHAALPRSTSTASARTDAAAQTSVNALNVNTLNVNVPRTDASEARTARASLGDTPESASIDPASSYRVQSDDTLIRIARKLYGRGSDWEKIYDANRDAIGPNPARLRVDMVLRLPQPPKATLN